MSLRGVTAHCTRLARASNLRMISARAFSSYGDEHRKGRVCVVTSGKGGVGKTTITASLAYTLATYGYKTVAVDFDIGLRNLDLHFGCERRVIYDLVNVMHQECGLGQALIKYRFDKKKHPDQIAKTTDGLKDPELYILAASQTRDKEVLTIESVERVINQLKKRFDYIVLDSPDDAIIATNPEISSCKDSDKMIGFIGSRSKRAIEGLEPVNTMLLVNRFDPARAASGESLELEDITDLLRIPLIGVIPESGTVLSATNVGRPVVLMNRPDNAITAIEDMTGRYLGQNIPMKFTEEEPESNSLLDSIFGRFQTQKRR